MAPEKDETNRFLVCACGAPWVKVRLASGKTFYECKKCKRQILVSQETGREDEEK